MKIVSIVGPRKSGKTTTTVLLIEEFKRRGLRVGTMKTIGCPAFTLDDPSSNTGKHKKAGADVVVARGQVETDFSFTNPLNPNKVFALLEDQLDLFLLEGGTDVMVPRIVCGKTIAEALERKNSYTFLVSGVIADDIEEIDGLKAISAMKDIAGLADAILEHVGEICLPVEVTEVDPKYRGFCTGGCAKDKGKALSEMSDECANCDISKE